MEEDEIKQKILEILAQRKIKNVRELVEIIQLEHGVRQEEILKLVLELQAQNVVNLKKEPFIISKNLIGYIFTRNSAWYWLIMVITSLTIVSVYIISDVYFPLMYVRYALGSLFVLILPGYTLIKALFPSNELDFKERITLSMGCSIAIVPLVGLLLNYTVWGIRITPIMFSLSIFTIILSNIGIYREYNSIRARYSH
jgi:hypothetical protein